MALAAVLMLLLRLYDPQGDVVASWNTKTASLCLHLLASACICLWENKLVSYRHNVTLIFTIVVNY